MATQSIKAAGCILLLLANCSHGTADTTEWTGHASARSVEAVALFGQFCLDAAPTLNAVDRSATNSAFMVYLDRPIAPGARQKEWLVPTSSKGAPMMLSVESGPSADGTKDVTVCGVLTPDASGVDIQHALANDRRLGEPKKVISPAPDGGTLVFWSAQVGGARQTDNAQVMLTSDVPGLPGPFINLTFKRQR